MSETKDAWQYRCRGCQAKLADVVVDGKALPRVTLCDRCTEAELPAAWREDIQSLNECLERVSKELEESRAAFLAAAQAIGIVYEAEGHAPAPGPVETVVEAIRDAARAKGRLIEAEMKLEQLQWGNEMACENTPHPACECAGCSLARDRARRGVAGPEDER